MYKPFSELRRECILFHFAFDLDQRQRAPLLHAAVLQSLKENGEGVMRIN